MLGVLVVHIAPHHRGEGETSNKRNGTVEEKTLNLLSVAIVCVVNRTVLLSSAFEAISSTSSYAAGMCFRFAVGVE